MTSDGVVLMFWVPMLLCLVALSVSYFMIDKVSATPKNFDVIGGRRIILGLSGAMFAILTYCCGTALMIGLGKVDQGHIDYLTLLKSFLGYCLYMFSFIGPFMMLGVLFIGLPLMMMLAKLRFASHTGALFLSSSISAFYSIYVAYNPYNNWCKANTLECVNSNFWSVFVACFVIAIGFSLAARFPAWRNSET
ncbi:hypothetical protein SOPP22_10395 [Shewanella sp. OPT22]|nr:hypothetical protein SOPP22_10395 [Shewanella sp. OPT22]